MKGTIGPNMKNVYELVIPALVHLGISEHFANTKNHQQRTNSESDLVGGVDGPANDASASSDQEGEEEAVHSGRLAFSRLGHRRVATINSGEKVEKRLNGLNARVIPIVVSDLSREGLGNASR